MVPGPALEAARDGDGYITSSTVRVESPGSAVLTEEIVIDNDSAVVDLPERLVGTVKVVVRVVASAERGDVFVGIGESEDVDAYLDGVATVSGPETDRESAMATSGLGAIPGITGVAIA
jgi:hypothetical protein